MSNKTEAAFAMHEYTIPTFCDNIRKSRVLVTEIEADYNFKRDTLIIRGKGGSGRGLSLTPSFLDSIHTELTEFVNEFVIPLVGFARYNFTLKSKVDSHGSLVLSDLQIIFKVDCKKQASIAEKFQQSFRILIPFTEYIDYISLRGGEYEVQVVEAEVNLSAEDLLEVIEMPIVGPTAKKQWIEFAVFATREAAKEYKLDVVIPVSDGEVTWDVQIDRTVQQVVSSSKNGQNTLRKNLR